MSCPGVQAPEQGSLLSVYKELHTLRKETSCLNIDKQSQTAVLIGCSVLVITTPSLHVGCLSLDPAGHNAKVYIPSLFPGQTGFILLQVGADDTCRTSISELLERRKTQPSQFCARWATAILLSSESLPPGLQPLRFPLQPRVLVGSGRPWTKQLPSFFLLGIRTCENLGSAPVPLAVDNSAKMRLHDSK